MTDEAKSTAVVSLTITLLVAIIAGSITYYQTHKPPLNLCQDACGHPGMVKSYDPQGGCTCR